MSFVWVTSLHLGRDGRKRMQLGKEADAVIVELG